MPTSADDSAPGPLWQRPVTYGAVGGTQAADLLAFPPAGFRPLVRRRRIGVGEHRFAWASEQTMTWGIQRRSGFDVAVQHHPSEVVERTYTPVTFDEEGVPAQPASVEWPSEVVFGASGESLLVPGETAMLTIRFIGVSVSAPVRVVYVIDEADRSGFGYGTLDGHPESGEESFIVSRESDGSVWLTITAFSRPSSWKWRLLALPLRVAQALYTRRYLSVLAGPID